MRGREYEGFHDIRLVQQEFERHGHYFYPVEKELAEALVTEPLVHRIRTQIKKRGFGNVASRVAITFSGYADDEREIFAIPEVRAYWRQLNQQLPELPALLAYLPLLGFN